tara:strand:- start:462 stop:1454 length:993 start_codon:yes stop_codon:yes gene_type:complete
MATINTIKFKSGTSAVPTSNLSAAEPLFRTDTGQFYIASDATTPNWVGAPILDEDNFSSNSAVKLATQQSIKAYVDAQISEETLDFSTDTGNGAVDLDSQRLAFTSGEGMDITHSSQAVTIAGEDATDSNKGIAKFPTADFAVSSGSVAIKAGGVTNTQLAGSIANAKLAGPAVSITDGSTASTIAPGGTITIQGTADEVAVAQSGGTYTVSLPDDVTIGDQLTVTGNLVVNGTTTTVSTATLAVEDNMISCAKANTGGDSLDIGIYGTYASSGTKYAGLARDRSRTDNAFVLFEDITGEPGNEVTYSASNHASLVCGAILEATIDGGTW